MTTRPLSRGMLQRPAVLDRLLARRFAIDAEVAIYLAIFALAFALRFWDLGARALHHDESIHADFTVKLPRGDFVHNPIFHGPFYYHVQALTFLVFGTSDYTARISAAIFGMFLTALPLLLRRQLGQVGTLAAVAFIAFSPTIVYYSRFFREDIYMAAFTLTMVVGMWRYFAGGRDRWLVVFALGLVGSLTTKEATYITAAAFLIYLNGYVAIELASGRLALTGEDTTGRRVALAAVLFPVAWLLTAFWPLLGGVRRWTGLTALPRPGDVLVVLGTLLLPILTPFLEVPLEEGVPVLRSLPLLGGVPFIGEGVIDKGQYAWDRVCRNGARSDDLVAIAGLFTVAGSAAAFVGLQWRPKTWAICAALGVAIYLTLMTTFWTNLWGVCSGPWGSLEYWLSQQDVRRGNQPWFYYYMVMPAYEFLPVVLCLAGAWWSLVRGNAFTRFIWVWGGITILLFSWAGEKMPWLNTHLALPACLLAAWTVQRAWDAWRPRPGLGRAGWTLLAIAVLAAGGLTVVAYLPGGAALNVLRAFVAVGVVAAIVAAARPLGRRAAPAIAAVAIIGALAPFSIKTMVTVVYERGDDPKDLLIYTQSSGEIPKIRTDIVALARATGEGYNLRIAVDTADSFAWPWAWYLRDFKNVTYVDLSASVLPPGEWSVMLVNAANAGKVNDFVLGADPGRFANPEKYPHRWWFEEQPYRLAIPTGPRKLDTWKTIGEGVFLGKWLDDMALFWRDHEPRLANGSVDAYAYFPANFDRETGTIVARRLEPPRPGVDRAGRPFFGGLGTNPGQFFAPVDIETDSAGNLYVVDQTLRRLQKFDPAGNFVAAADIRVDPQNRAEQSQPWGLGIAPNGDLIVADTFGWRVRGFTSDLQPSGLLFGQPPDAAKRDPGPFDLFGPRDAAFDDAGNLWVTDTGHGRIVVYAAGGRFVRSIGTKGSGQGQFDEPVGLARAADGAMVVADMYNRRVVILDQQGNVTGGFAVDAWGGQDVNDKPYLRPLRDGRIAVSLPLLGQVRIYDRTGKIASAIAPADEPLVRPYGIAETADGKLWVVEGGSGRVRQFPIP